MQVRLDEIVVAVIIAILVLGGFGAAEYFGNKVIPHHKAPVWKHVLYYICLVLFVLLISRMLHQE